MTGPETHRPKMAEVHRVIDRDRLIRQRIDALRKALAAQLGPWRGLPAPHRDQLQAELDRLTAAKPELLVDTVGGNGDGPTSTKKPTGPIRRALSTA